MKFQAIWVAEVAGKPVFTHWPRPASPCDVIITNRELAFEGIHAGHVVDIQTLQALTQVNALDTKGVIQVKDAATLWQAWLAARQELENLPLWVLESVTRLSLFLGDRALAALFDFWAATRHASAEQATPWHNSFVALQRWPEKRVLPSTQECESLDVAHVQSYLAPQGALARLIPQYEAREGQLAMLRAVAETFNAGHHLMIEAGTGVGKSLAYLLPAACWALLNDMPVMVSTNTRNLQSQLMHKDLPLVQTLLESHTVGEGLRVALLKGRTNYLCLRRLGILLEQGEFELERLELRQFMALLIWSARTADGDLDNFKGGLQGGGGLKAKITSTAEECPGRACRYARRCFLHKARAYAGAAHVVVVNHALVFTEANTQTGILPAYSQIIFDEAHNLEEVATKHLSIELNETRARSLLRYLSRGSKKRRSGVLESLKRSLKQGALHLEEEQAAQTRKMIRRAQATLEALESAAYDFFDYFNVLLDRERAPVRFRCLAPGLEGGTTREICRNKVFVAMPAHWSEHFHITTKEALKELLKALLVCLEELVNYLRQSAPDELPLYVEHTIGLESAMSMIRDFILDLDFVCAASSPEYVFWVEDDPYNALKPRLYAAPLAIGATLAELFYENKTSIIFCSATLRVSSSFKFVSKRLGLDLSVNNPVRFEVAASPFNYLRQCAVVVPAFLPEPIGKAAGGYVEQLSALMLDIFTKTKGRALGLFTSYEMMNEVARLLEGPLQEQQIRLLLHGVSGSRDQLTREFRAGDHCVLLGTHSFWEGVDVTGEALSCVVLARLPFAAITNPVVEARCEQIEQAGGSAFREFSLPQAVIKFRQGFGRLIRSGQDYGMVVVADPRIVTKNYGATFVKSLPCPVKRFGERDPLLAFTTDFFQVKGDGCG